MLLMELNVRKAELIADFNQKLKQLVLDVAATIPLHGSPDLSVTLSDGSIAHINAKVGNVLHGGSPDVSVEGFIDLLAVLARHPAITGVPDPAAAPIAPQPDHGASALPGVAPAPTPEGPQS